MIGHHLAISAFCQAPSASGVDLSAGGICKPRFSSCLRVAGSFSASSAAALSFGDDVFRRALRRPQARPQRHVESGQAGFVHSRNIGCGLRPLGVGDGITADGPGAHLVDGIGELIDDEVDLSGNEIVHRRSRAAIGHILQLEAGCRLEPETGNMACGAGACRAGGRRLWPRLQPAINSFSVFAGTAFLLTTIMGLLGSSTIGSRSVTRS